MKRLQPLVFFLLLAGIWLLCSSDIGHDPYYGYTPFFMKRADLEKSVQYVDGQREMQDPGKIWVAGNLIFVNERYKGVHIIDNSDPSSPDQIGFITAPGCLDMAVKGDIIYLDNAVDLVAFDMVRKTETHRIKNHFPEPQSPDGRRYYNYSSNMVLVGWKNNKK